MGHGRGGGAGQDIPLALFNVYAGVIRGARTIPSLTRCLSFQCNLPALFQVLRVMYRAWVNISSPKRAYRFHSPFFRRALSVYHGRCLHGIPTQKPFPQSGYFSKLKTADNTRTNNATTTHVPCFTDHFLPYESPTIMTLMVATRSGGRASAGRDNERDECSLLAFPGGVSCRGARVSMRGDPQGATQRRCPPGVGSRMLSADNMKYRISCASPRSGCKRSVHKTRAPPLPKVLRRSPLQRGGVKVVVRLPAIFLDYTDSKQNKTRVEDTPTMLQ